MKILILGAQGMLGHVVERYFKEKKHEVYCTTRRDKNSDLYFNIDESVSDIDKIIKKIKPDVLINCIGILNKEAEINKPLAIMTNSYLPHYLDSLSEKENFKLIHISTDCVFEGDQGNYTEDSQPDATSFYGRTKALGEINNSRNVTLRTSIVGPDINDNGIGLFQWFMKQEGTVYGYDKVLWTGVTTMWLTKCIDISIRENLTGLHHCVNNQTISKYDLLKLFKKHFNKKIKIFKDSSVATTKTLLRTNKSFDFGIPDYNQMVKEMREWVDTHKELYPNLLEDIQK